MQRNSCSLCALFWFGVAMTLALVTNCSREFDDGLTKSLVVGAVYADGEPVAGIIVLLLARTK